MLRILMGIQRLWRGGGTETHVLTLALHMKKLGHHVTIYTSGGEWVTKARNMGLTVQLYSRAALKSGSGLRTLQAFISRNHFDVLHAHDSYSLNRFVTALAGLRKRPKLIFTVHGPYVSKTALLRAQKWANAIIAVSSEIRRTLPASVNRKKVYIVSNGISTDVFRPGSGRIFRNHLRIHPQSFLVGYSGRFTFDKVILGRRVVKALQLYMAKSSGVDIVISGRGSKQVVRSMPRLRVLGHVDKINQFYRACDVVIGTGRTAAEALLCGRPVIAIGKAGYHGLVGPNNITAMLRTNFGDHGRHKPWSPGILVKDLRTIRNSGSQLRRQSGIVRDKVISQLSAQRMAYRIQKIYQSRS